MKKFINLKFILQLLIVCGVTFGGLEAGLATNATQALTLAVFSAVITTTLLFWERRVGVAFIGVALLVGCKAMTLRQMLTGTELDIILFLVGMMIIVGVLKDLGFLTWVIQVIIRRKNMTGVSFTAILGVLSAVMASVVDEVSSIVVVLALVFQVCETLKLRPHPFVLIAVMATNIGSSATMLGNPVGIFIGNKAGFTFSQFLVGATPVAFVALVCTFLITVFWFRKDIHAMSEAMAAHRKTGLGPTAKIPYKAGLVVLLVTVIVIAFHHQIEGLLGLEGADNHNAFLIMTPLVVAGILMILRPARARHYVENDVEWWTLLFFMLLFSISASLSTNGITGNLAKTLTQHVKGGPTGMIPFVVLISSLGSAFVDNIVFVAAFTPVVQELMKMSSEYSVLWWALLFGACYGGNITVVGSTANIVASGLLEKHGYHPVKFGDWIKIGALVGLVSGIVAWIMLLIMPVPKPEAASTAEQAPALESQAPAPQVPEPQEPTPVAAESVPPPPQVETAAVAAPAAPTPVDELAELERLGEVAKQAGADYLTPAREWAGGDFQRKMWICDVAQRTGRAADLVVLAREAQAACSGDRATFGNFCRVARYFKAGASFDEARKALEQAIPLAETKEQRDYLATFWRGLATPAEN